MRRLLAALALLAGCAHSDPLEEVFGADGRTLRQEIESFPPELKESFALAERHCSRCHSLNQPFAAHLAAGAWRAEIRKMQRKPGAAIPDAAADRIAAFFEHLDERRRAAKTP